MKLSRFALALFAFGAFAALISIAAAAFAAHGVANVAPRGEQAAAWFAQAAGFQMDHALGLILITLAAEFAEKGISTTLMRTGALLLVGAIVLFPGSLYWASFGGSSALTPIGGFAAMGGWVVFGVGALSALLRKRTYL